MVELQCAVGGDSSVCVCKNEFVVDTVNICNCYSGAYNNAGLVSVGGVITASGPPPPYNSTHKVAGTILERAYVCKCAREKIDTS